MLNNFLYFFAGVLTISAIIATITLYNKLKLSRQQPALSQSQTYLFFRTMFPNLNMSLKIRDKQSSAYDNSKIVKYVETDENLIYWLDKNKVYCAELNEDGFFNTQDAQRVSLKNLSEEQVNSLLVILSHLKSE
jgi:hypothetical protein